MFVNFEVGALKKWIKSKGVRVRLLAAHAGPSPRVPANVHPRMRGNTVVARQLPATSR
jgi:hypothetical protein